MGWLVGLGALLTLAGLGLLGYCIMTALRVQRSDADDEAKRAALQPLVAMNMGGVALSVFGLIVLVVGLLLGS